MASDEQTWTVERAEALDRDDPLRQVRGRFVLPDGVVYLDGNSLGPLSRDALERAAAVVRDEWGAGLIAGWNELGWMESSERVGARIAPLIGARPGEVVAVDTTTIALSKVVLSACQARAGRRAVVTTTTNFPTDLYAIEACADLAGMEVRRVEPSALSSALTGDVATLVATHVDFRTGEMLDLGSLTEAAHAAGALAVWDLSHSAGAVPVGLDEHQVDLAIGCGYKYLNGGPGAPAFVYVRREMRGEVRNPLPGWLGHDSPFEFAPDWRPAPGIAQWVTSTPPVIGLAILEAALGCFEGVSIDEIRRKSVALTSMFIDAVAQGCGEGGFELASPSEPERRGSQVSLRHPDASRVMQELSRIGVVGDFRPPNICRFGFGPLYLSHSEVLRAAEQVAAAISR